MIDFMVLGLPRSGTTWAANWLTTDTTYCLHDPLYKVHYSEWDSNTDYFPTNVRKVGVSCTGIWRWPDWVNRHPARKVILTRDIGEVQMEMDRLGLGGIEVDAHRMLADIEGLHVPYTDLFDAGKAAAIWGHLIGGTSFNPMRHATLREYGISPNFNSLVIAHKLQQVLIKELVKTKKG